MSVHKAVIQMDLLVIELRMKELELQLEVEGELSAEEHAEYKQLSARFRELWDSPTHE